MHFLLSIGIFPRSRLNRILLFSLILVALIFVAIWKLIPKSETRILCYVLLSPSKLREAKTIDETWGRHCDKLIFFGSPTPKLVLSWGELVHLEGIIEGYPYLWNKTKGALKYLNTKYSMNYNWFVKGDHDTFFVINNLRMFIGSLTSTYPLWFGYKLKDSTISHGYMSGGAGYVLSKEGLRRIIQVLNTGTGECEGEKPIGYEDLELGKCAAEAGLVEVSTRDKLGRERFLPLRLTEILNRNISQFHWIWNQAWNTLQVGLECCSPELISIHHIQHHEMRTLYFLLSNVSTRGDGN